MVYLSNCEVPIVMVDNKKLHGQKVDQLLKVVLLKQTGNTIGANTSIGETQIPLIGDEINNKIVKGKFFDY